jgi:hypothetical protein
VHHGHLRIVDDPSDGVYSVVEFDSRSAAYGYLRDQFEYRPRALAMLEVLVEDEDEEEDDEELEDAEEDDEEDPAFNTGRSQSVAQRQAIDRRSDELAVLRTVARLIDDGQLGVAEQVHRFNPPTKLDEMNEAPPPAPPPEPLRQEKKLTWIEIKIMNDQTGQPVNWVRLTVKTPDGNEAYYTTNAAGIIRIDDIEPGTCDVSCDVKGVHLKDTLSFVGTGEPKGGGNSDLDGQPTSTVRIAQIEEHKVKKGETLDGLAKAAGMTWKELANFNWGVQTPNEINEHLRDDVGCTKKTSDGANYVFDDSDDPGLVYIPKPWKQEGLATAKTHVFRVKVIYTSCALCVRLDIDPQEAAKNEDKFILSSDDQSYSVTKTVKDDKQEGDQYIDLRYAKLNPDKNYTLKVTAADGSEVTVFEGIPYAELAGLSPKAQSGVPKKSESPEEEKEVPEEGPESPDYLGELLSELE